MNEYQGKVSYHVLYNTDMKMEEFMNKFHQDNIIDMQIQITLSDGSLHTVQVCDLLDAVVTSYVEDGEEVFNNDIIEKEKITNMGSVIKIAI
jgi:hypothetical protein